MQPDKTGDPSELRVGCHEFCNLARQSRRNVNPIGLIESVISQARLVGRSNHENTKKALRALRLRPQTTLRNKVQSQPEGRYYLPYQIGFWLSPTISAKIGGLFARREPVDER
jgi:hypothetical protein